MNDIKIFGLCLRRILENMIAYLTITVLLIAAFWFMMPLEITKTVKVPEDVFAPGSALRTVLYYDKETERLVNATEEFLDKHGNPVMIQVPNTEVITQIPKNLPPGEYKIRYQFAVGPTFLRPVRLEYVTPIFKVAEKSENDNKQSK